MDNVLSNSNEYYYICVHGDGDVEIYRRNIREPYDINWFTQELPELIEELKNLGCVCIGEAVSKMLKTYERIEL